MANKEKEMLVKLQQRQSAYSTGGGEIKEALKIKRGKVMLSTEQANNIDYLFRKANNLKLET